MNVLKALKVAELRKKVAIIPAKIIMAVAFMIVVMWDTSIDKVWENVKADPKHSLYLFLIIYGAVSYVYFFIKIMHNWILGIIIAAGAAVLVYTQVGKLGGQALTIALIVMIVGGPLFDLINYFRYRNLKAEVIRAEEDRAEESYGDGYDEGFSRGVREGQRLERRKYREIERERDRYYDERALQDKYDDEYEDEYDEEYEEDSEDYSDDEYSDEYIEDKEYGRETVQGNSENAAGFFADCKTPAAIKRRYHDLCKVYHPDSGNGSSDIFYRIKEEYDRLK